MPIPVLRKSLLENLSLIMPPYDLSIYKSGGLDESSPHRM
jgi:hypothetical protein